MWSSIQVLSNQASKKSFYTFEDIEPVIHTFNIFEESKMCHILTSNSTHYLIISGYIFLEEHYIMCDVLSDNFRIGLVKESGGSDMLVIFDQIHYKLNLLAFGQMTTRQILIKLLSNQDQYIHF